MSTPGVRRPCRRRLRATEKKIPLSGTALVCWRSTSLADRTHVRPHAPSVADVPRFAECGYRRAETPSATTL